MLKWEVNVRGQIGEPGQRDNLNICQLHAPNKKYTDRRL